MIGHFPIQSVIRPVGSAGQTNVRVGPQGLFDILAQNAFKVECEDTEVVCSAAGKTPGFLNSLCN